MTQIKITTRLVSLADVLAVAGLAWLWPESDAALDRVRMQAAFGELIGKLRDRRLDMIAAGSFITPDPARRTSFTEPTVRVGALRPVPTGHARSLDSYADLIIGSGQRLEAIARFGSTRDDLAGGVTLAELKGP